MIFCLSKDMQQVQKVRASLEERAETTAQHILTAVAMLTSEGARALMAVHLICPGTYVWDDIVEIVMFNEDSGAWGHPMPLHGHSFYVMGTGRLTRSQRRREKIMEMDASGELRRNYVNPPLRDTVNVMDEHYTIIRFKADNPGFWFFHCHIDGHLAQGKELIIKIGDYDEFPAVPDTFPRTSMLGNDQ